MQGDRKISEHYEKDGESVRNREKGCEREEGGEEIKEVIINTLNRKRVKKWYS